MTKKKKRGSIKKKEQQKEVKKKIKIYSKALEEYIHVERSIGTIHGKKTGPTLVVLSGIHGNEPSGLFAAISALKKLDPNQMSGNIYALAGNMNALKKNIRYESLDLNRLWNEEHLSTSIDENTVQDIVEQRELYQSIIEIKQNNSGPFYFIDLHTTSSKTVPFLTINNHKPTLDFSNALPFPKVTGIDNFVKGAYFTFMNQDGHIALGFEAGQHDDKEAIEYHEVFIYLILAQAGIISKKYADDLLLHANFSSKNNDNALYEIKSRFVIESSKMFEMKKGFVNFQPVNQGQLLAQYDGKEIVASEKARIFLPLYQAQGNDGFFVIKEKSNTL